MVYSQKQKLVVKIQPDTIEVVGVGANSRVGVGRGCPLALWPLGLGWFWFSWLRTRRPRTHEQYNSLSLRMNHVQHGRARKDKNLTSTRFKRHNPPYSYSHTLTTEF
jgi:hypothetical protein